MVSRKSDPMGHPPSHSYPLIGDDEGVLTLACIAVASDSLNLPGGSRILHWFYLYHLPLCNTLLIIIKSSSNISKTTTRLSRGSGWLTVQTAPMQYHKSKLYSIFLTLASIDKFLINISISPLLIVFPSDGWH